MIFAGWENDEGFNVISFSGWENDEGSNVMSFSGYRNDDEGSDAISLSDVQDL